MHVKPVVVRPSDWEAPSDVKSSDRASWNIAAWEHALEKVTSYLSKLPNRCVVILDTCGTSPDTLRTILGVAELHKHVKIAMLMAVKPEVCATRIDPGIIEKYNGKITNSIYEYKKSCDLVIAIRNDSIEQWKSIASEKARQICAIINKEY
jgi:hypothetical protein